MTLCLSLAFYMKIVYLAYFLTSSYGSLLYFIGKSLQQSIQSSGFNFHCGTEIAGSLRSFKSGVYQGSVKCYQFSLNVIGVDNASQQSGMLRLKKIAIYLSLTCLICFSEYNDGYLFGKR